MTRLPRSPRILPAQASLLLEENLLNHFSIVALTAKEYCELARKLGRENVAGGQAYDALHLASAGKCEAHRIFTFNVGHFAGLAAHLASKIAVP